MLMETIVPIGPIVDIPTAYKEVQICADIRTNAEEITASLITCKLIF